MEKASFKVKAHNGLNIDIDCSVERNKEGLCDFGHCVFFLGENCFRFDLDFVESELGEFMEIYNYEGKALSQKVDSQLLVMIFDVKDFAEQIEKWIAFLMEHEDFEGGE